MSLPCNFVEKLVFNETPEILDMGYLTKGLLGN